MNIPVNIFLNINLIFYRGHLAKITCFMPSYYAAFQFDFKSSNVA